MVMVAVLARMLTVKSQFTLFGPISPAFTQESLMCELLTCNSLVTGD